MKFPYSQMSKSFEVSSLIPQPDSHLLSLSIYIHQTKLSVIFITRPILWHSNQKYLFGTCNEVYHIKMWKSKNEYVDTRNSLVKSNLQNHRACCFSLREHPDSYFYLDRKCHQRKQPHFLPASEGEASSVHSSCSFLLA